MEFSDEVKALLGQYQQNIKVIRNESTIELFTCILKNPTNQVRVTNTRNIRIGRFYIIQYNYNGNKLWCPILTIPPIPNKKETGFLETQLKIKNEKSILYAVNFDYLPLRYKIALIETIITNNIDKYEKNKDKIANDNPVKEEFSFNVNGIYNFLKTNGNKNYAITAYDVLKIEKVVDISTTILHRFVFLDTFYINKRLMYDTLEHIQNEDIKMDFSNKIKMFEKILEMYETDLEYFYKALRNFEQNLKLVEEL